MKNFIFKIERDGNLVLIEREKTPLELSEERAAEKKGLMRQNIYCDTKSMAANLIDFLGEIKKGNIIVKKLDRNKYYTGRGCTKGATVFVLYEYENKNKKEVHQNMVLWNFDDEPNNLGEWKKALQEFKKFYGLRDNWHEPDEQDISAIVVGERFDNACGQDIQGLRFKTEVRPSQEIVVILYKGNVAVGKINLATLFAVACLE